MKKLTLNFFDKYGFYLSVILIWILVFHNNLYDAYFYDDYGQILDNENLQNIKNFQCVIFCGMRQIRLFQNITFAIDFFFTGINPFSFHVTNNLIHLCNTFLLFSFLKKIKGIPFFVAALSTLIYLVHPLQVDSVTYIMGRTTLLQNLSIFLVLNETAKGENRSRLKIFFSLIFSYLVKENCTLIPFLVLLFDYYLQPQLFTLKTLKKEYVF